MHGGEAGRWGLDVGESCTQVAVAYRICLQSLPAPLSTAGYCQCCCRYVKCQGKVSEANQALRVKPPGFLGELSLCSPGLGRCKAQCLHSLPWHLCVELGFGRHSEANPSSWWGLGVSKHVGVSDPSGICWDGGRGRNGVCSRWFSEA